MRRALTPRPGHRPPASPSGSVGRAQLSASAPRPDWVSNVQRPASAPRGGRRHGADAFDASPSPRPSRPSPSVALRSSAPGREMTRQGMAASAQQAVADRTFMKKLLTLKEEHERNLKVIEKLYVHSRPNNKSVARVSRVPTRRVCPSHARARASHLLALCAPACCCCCCCCWLVRPGTRKRRLPRSASGCSAAGHGPRRPPIRLRARAAAPAPATSPRPRRQL
jgi:hypothetical protein